MAAKDFKVDDLVWAKMKCFPPWPARIALPEDGKCPNIRKAQHFVYFFGTNNVAWILDENITPHSDEMLKNSESYKKMPAGLQKAIEEIKSESSKCEGAVALVNSSPAFPSSSEVQRSAPGPKKGSKKRFLSRVFGASFKLTKKVAKQQPTREASSPDHEETNSGKDEVRSALHSRELSEKVLSSEESDQEELMFKTSVMDTVHLPGPSDSPSRSKGYSKVAVINPFSKEDESHFSAPVNDRPVYPRPPTPVLNMKVFPESVKNERIVATKKKIGFLGLGIIGRGMVKNLLYSGHHVTVWNRTPDRCEVFVAAGAKQAATPFAVVQECDIIFCCVADAAAVRLIVFGNYGVLKGFNGCHSGSKGYVEMTNIDPLASQEIAEAISDKGGRYLEAPILGSRELSEEGHLLILGAGDNNLFKECESCFKALAKDSFYMGHTVGHASKMSIVLSMLAGTTFVAIAEAMALLDACQLPANNFLQVLQLGELGSPAVLQKVRRMMHNDYVTNTALKHQQKDLQMALALGQLNRQPLHLTAAAHEIFKRANMLQYSDHDVAAVYLSVKRLF